MILLIAACSAPPEATEEFSDAARAAFSRFGDDDPAGLVEAVNALVDQVTSEVDVHASSYVDRSLTPEALQEEDLATIDEHTSGDPSTALPVAVAWGSPHAPSDHARIMLLADQTPVEPNSPNLYDRTFLSGGDCFPTSCDSMQTENDVVKENALFAVSMVLWKNFRRIDLDEEHEALVSRAWLKDPAESENGDTTIEQSYGLELFAETSDGATRLTVMWAETVFANADYSDDLIAGTSAFGVDQMFKAYDDWLDEN